MAQSPQQVKDDFLGSLRGMYTTENMRKSASDAWENVKSGADTLRKRIAPTEKEKYIQSLNKAGDDARVERANESFRKAAEEEAKRKDKATGKPSTRKVGKAPVKKRPASKR